MICDSQKSPLNSLHRGSPKSSIPARLLPHDCQANREPIISRPPRKRKKENRMAEAIRSPVLGKGARKGHGGPAGSAKT